MTYLGTYLVCDCRKGTTHRQRVRERKKQRERKIYITIDGNTIHRTPKT